MVYIMGLLLLGTLGMIFLLSYYDVTVKEARYKIIRKITKAPLPSNTIKAPYYRKKNTIGKIHKPILLNIETSDGSGQVCHPDVTYIMNGFGSGQWCYWMVCTPYPFGNTILENPEVFASHDGITWEIPDGLHNPIAQPFPKIGDYNSDPDMMICDNKLWLYYREVQCVKKIRENHIMLRQSSDGVNWSEPVAVLRTNPGIDIVSPALIFRETLFFMWTIEEQENRFRLTRRKSHDGMKWEAPTTTNVIGIGEDRHIWHIDVIDEKERLSALVVTTLGRGGNSARIHYGYSLDEGITWFIGPFLMEQVYEFESKCQYRATFRKIMENPHRYEIWYSAANKQSIWSMAYLQFVREENNLYPDTAIGSQSVVGCES